MIAIPNIGKPQNCAECPISALSEFNGIVCKLNRNNDKSNCPLIDIVKCGECKWWNSGFCNNGRADANLKLEGNCFCDEGERRVDEN